MDQFRVEKGLNPPRNPKDDFVRAASARSHGVLPDPKDDRAVAAYLLDLLAPPLDIDVVSALREWIAQRWPQGA